jgi:hypothetical protein
MLDLQWRKVNIGILFAVLIKLEISVLKTEMDIESPRPSSHGSMTLNYSSNHSNN